MKPVKAFILQYCPYCQKAKRAYAELSEQYPVPFEWIDEAKEAALADQYDYYYTPTFYVDEKKVYEAQPGQSYQEIRDRVEQVLQLAME